MKQLALCLALLAFACTDEEGSRAFLRDQGYTNIRLEGFAPLRCMSKEWSTEYTARSPAGREVSGVVCCSVWGCRFSWW